MTRPSRALLVLTLLAMLAACRRETRDAPPPRSSPQASPIVGAVLMQQDQFFRLNATGMRETAELSRVDLRVQNAAGALDKEVTIIETFVTQGVGAIVVSPLSTEASIPALRRAHERGVKVVTYNNALAADFPVFSISSDQVSLGATSGQAARAFIETRLSGTARVALIGFASQLPEQGGARVAGFKSALEGLPGVEIVAEQDAWTAPQAATTVSELLAKGPTIVWAANEGGTVGAVTAVMSAGKAGQVFVFGTDISTQLVDFMLSDRDVLQAVTAQAPIAMGSAAVEAAVKAMRGEALEKSVVLPGVLFSRDRPDDLRAMRAKLEAAAQ